VMRHDSNSTLDVVCRVVRGGCVQW
jgi:hypothetical protein